MKYRKRPVVVDAVQWNGFEKEPVIPEIQVPYLHPECTKYGQGWIPTLEGGHVVTPGDWIITGVKGEKYPCKPDIFELTYTSVPSNEEEAVEKAAKWLAAVIENGEAYDGFEDMAWSEFAGGEEMAEPFRELAVELLSICQRWRLR